MMRVIAKLAMPIALLPSGLAAAAAEPVRIGVEADGHGWLFGDDDGACWVAAPLHVVGDKAAGTAAPFVFYKGDLTEGGTDAPIPVADVPGALAATGGQADLAFAKVAYGADDCRAGLGLPDYVYRRSLERGDPIRFVSMLTSSYAYFDAVPARVRADEGAGLVLRARPVREADRAYLVEGLSGSVGTIADTFGDARPFAMALSVPPDQMAVTALRFDAIRAAFDALTGQAADEDEGDGDEAQAPRIAITTLTGVSVEAATGPGALASQGGCFRAVPAAGERYVRVAFAPPGDLADSVSLTGTRDCGEGTGWIVEYRTGQGGSWRGGVTCTATAAPAPCPLGRSGVSEIRLTAAAPGEAALRRVRVP